jgi:hypothetical protein
MLTCMRLSSSSTREEHLTADNTDRGTSLGDANIECVIRELTAIRADMIAEPVMSKTRLSKIHPNYLASARNLMHYLALRRHDLRPLQLRLAEMGLVLSRANRVARPGHDRRGSGSPVSPGTAILAAAIDGGSRSRFCKRATAACRTHRSLVGPRTPPARCPNHGHHAERGRGRLHARS